MKQIIVAFIIFTLFLGCEKDTSQSKNFQENRSLNNCDSMKYQKLVSTILNYGHLYGFSETAKFRNFEIVEANSLMEAGKEFKTSFDFNIRVIDSLDLSETGGILRFLQIDFSNDSSSVYLETKYYGDSLRPLNNTILELNYNPISCEWILIKSEFSVY